MSFTWYSWHVLASGVALTTVFAASDEEAELAAASPGGEDDNELAEVSPFCLLTAAVSLVGAASSLSMADVASLTAEATAVVVVVVVVASLCGSSDDDAFTSL